MIFIGTTNLTRTRDRGQFYCPNCRCDQPYCLRSRRPFLTVYFIPTVPIGDAQRYIQCDECGQRWDQSVMHFRTPGQPTIDRESFEYQAFHAAILVVLIDETIDEVEIAVLHDIAIRLSGEPVDRETLGRWCSIAQENRISAVNYAWTLSRRWDTQQRAEALGVMFLAATAHGEMNTLQSDTLARMRDIFDFSDDQYRRAIESAFQ
ncbi:TerB family tellurite resistance protein [Stieleria varia]|uniref:Tellurite resistance protein TerB n=1 Tax=Stieleria varia TaxID=2528005 RepID=A0A5C5ZYM7_9BACT|nr:TerB family tellurite resistance protein [Stieleria varia]TWT92111.1 Tellurite resistance protein TerB [Stieleria varia]